MRSGDGVDLWAQALSLKGEREIENQINKGNPSVQTSAFTPMSCCYWEPSVWGTMAPPSLQRKPNGRRAEALIRRQLPPSSSAPPGSLSNQRGCACVYLTKPCAWQQDKFLYLKYLVRQGLKAVKRRQSHICCCPLLQGSGARARSVDRTLQLTLRPKYNIGVTVKRTQNIHFFTQGKNPDPTYFRSLNWNTRVILWGRCLFTLISNQYDIISAVLVISPNSKIL